MHIAQHKRRYQYMCDNILAYHTYLNEKIIYLESFLLWNIHTECAVNPVWNSVCCNIHIQHIRLRSDCSQIRFVYQIRPDRESVCTVICKWPGVTKTICMDCCGSDVGVSHYVCSCRRFSKLKHEKKCRLPIDNAVRSQSKQLISEEFSDMSDQSEMQL